MILLKACPRCAGDIIFDSDVYGRYTKCLQCGSMKDVMENQDDSGAQVELVREVEVEAA